MKTIAEQFVELGIVSSGRAAKAKRRRDRRICKKCQINPCICDGHVTQPFTTVRQTRPYRRIVR